MMIAPEIFTATKSQGKWLLQVVQQIRKIMLLPPALAILNDSNQVKIVITKIFSNSPKSRTSGCKMQISKTVYWKIEDKNWHPKSWNCNLHATTGFVTHSSLFIALLPPG
jgi:hypothetical protein